MKVYKVVLKNGKKFYVESHEDYRRIFARYYKRYGQELAAVFEEYGVNSIEDIKRERRC